MRIDGETETRREGRTDRLGKANIRFSGFCKRAKNASKNNDRHLSEKKTQDPILYTHFFPHDT
jgi:hypothetical protein